MKNYTITIDTGTTNTRVFLFNENNEPVSSAKSEIGVRITAIDGNNDRLKAAIKGCLEDVLKQAGVTYENVKRVVASGMITSNVGLTEIPRGCSCIRRGSRESGEKCPHRGRMPAPDPLYSGCEKPRRKAGSYDL